ncbi:hypothetical protein BDW75DRAFT_229008 [Aspergillus navahoensis]
MTGSGAAAKVDPKEIALLTGWIQPTLWAMYFLNFMDRNALVNSKLNSLVEDLNLKGAKHNTCVRILFVPSNMLLNRVKHAWYMAGFITAMLSYRAVLGIVEAPFYEGALFMISFFYSRKEATTRMVVLYMGSMLASLFSGLISAAVFVTIDKKHGLAGWQQIAYDRDAGDSTQKEENTSDWTGFREACLDYRTWIFALIFAVACGNLNTGAQYFAMILFVGATFGWPVCDAPRFAPGMYASIGFSAGMVRLAWVMRLILMRGNKQPRAADPGVINLCAY